ncbi:uncharacterized protein LOC134769345 [Penaeus indicus]|uniref:uncharacterized protein LOC134769345 n=1 Tax=Penaeus indicus TaxID=29960 RepID=UPI00300D2F8C
MEHPENDLGHTSSTSLSNWSRRRPCDLESPGVGLAYIVQGRRGRGRQAAVEDESSNMRVLVLLAFVLGCNANLVLLPYPVAQQYRSQGLFGQTSFGHFSFDQNQQQTRLPDGTVVGYYSYIGADGKPAVTIYEAGRQGFQVKGSNILPEAPEAPAPPELKAPEPVRETPEVVKARADFQQKFDEAISTRKRRSVQIPLPYFHPVPTVAKSPHVPGVSNLSGSVSIGPGHPLAPRPSLALVCRRDVQHNQVFWSNTENKILHSGNTAMPGTINVNLTKISDPIFHKIGHLS